VFFALSFIAVIFWYYLWLFTSVQFKKKRKEIFILSANYLQKILQRFEIRPSVVIPGTWSVLSATSWLTSIRHWPHAVRLLGTCFDQCMVWNPFAIPRISTNFKIRHITFHCSYATSSVYFIQLLPPLVTCQIVILPLFFNVSMCQFPSEQDKNKYPCNKPFLRFEMYSYMSITYKIKTVYLPQTVSLSVSADN
jgi:hypothetical protein